MRLTLDSLAMDPARALDLPLPEAAALLARVGALQAMLTARVGSTCPTTNVNGLLTVEEVARALALKPSTVRAYAERGSLPCARLGNRLRFRASDVSLWIQERHSKGGN